MIVIGITGTIGAGKGTIVEYLIEKGFKHFSVRDYLTKEILKRKLKVTRNNLVNVGNELRKKYGPGYIIEKLYKEALKKDKDTVIESIRTVGEINALKGKKNVFIFSVGAKVETRFKRIKKRGTKTDKISFKEFLEDDKREMTSKDPFKQNLAECIRLSDYEFKNNNSKKDLFNKVEKILKEINAL